MPEINVRDISNNIKGSITLPDGVFGFSARKDIIHESVINFLANQRQGTHATKTKGLVSGGGKKPWKQKHTGRARSGSNRSPLWRGGGIIFGPQPRDYSYSLPKTFKKRALTEALSAKLSNNQITVVDSINMERPKTKEMARIIRNLGFEGKKLLIVLKEKNENILFSSRNIQGVRVLRASDVNPYDLMTHDMILTTPDAVDAMSEACLS